MDSPFFKSGSLTICVNKNAPMRLARGRSVEVPERLSALWLCALVRFRTLRCPVWQVLPQKVMSRPRIAGEGRGRETAECSREDSNLHVETRCARLGLASQVDACLPLSAREQKQGGKGVSPYRYRVSGDFFSSPVSAVGGCCYFAGTEGLLPPAPDCHARTADSVSLD